MMKYQLKFVRLLFLAAFYIAISCRVECSDCLPPSDSVENYIFRFINQTDKNLTIESYSRHLPQNYTPVDDQDQYVEHIRIDRSDGTERTRVGPKHIDSTLFLYNRFETNSKESFSFTFLNDEHNPFINHLFSDFDERYAYPQIDSVEFIFEDGKQITYEMEGNYLFQLPGEEDHFFDIRNYKMSVLKDSTINDTTYITTIYTYTVTHDLYKDAR